MSANPHVQRQLIGLVLVGGLVASFSALAIAQQMTTSGATNMAEFGSGGYLAADEHALDDGYDTPTGTVAVPPASKLPVPPPVQPSDGDEPSPGTRADCNSNGTQDDVETRSSFSNGTYYTTNGIGTRSDEGGVNNTGPAETADDFTVTTPVNIIGGTFDTRESNTLDTANGGFVSNRVFVALYADATSNTTHVPAEQPTAYTYVTASRVDLPGLGQAANRTFRRYTIS